jgi:DNA-binding winged helix-turn-helix (wHTH) protein
MFLATLLSRPGELVTREELQGKLWPAESFGDFEHGLNAAVNRVREALSDSADQPRFIETLPRRGYRFISPVERNGDGSTKMSLEATGNAVAKIESEAVHSDGEPRTRRESSGARVRPLLIVLAVLAVGLAVALGLYFRMRASGGQDSSVAEDVTILPLTTLPGEEVEPTFSPDGSQVAFGWDGGNSEAPERFDLYVKVVGTENVERLTQHPAQWISPAWSPDGSMIAFSRESASNAGVFLISARGGPERRLAQAPPPGFGDRPTWSPDGRELIYSFDRTLHVAVQRVATENGRRLPGLQMHFDSLDPATPSPPLQVVKCAKHL